MKKNEKRDSGATPNHKGKSTFLQQELLDYFFWCERPKKRQCNETQETTGMTTENYTRSPDTPPRAMASDPHVRARREGDEAFLPPARHSRVFLSLARSNCARKPDSNQLLPKKEGTNNHGTTASVVPTAAPAHDTWLHQTTQLLQTVTFRPKTAHSVFHVTRETCFVNTSATLLALSTFCSRNRPVDTQD